jgi:hypothetical protein
MYRTNNGMRGTILQWTTSTMPCSKFPDGTVQSHVQRRRLLEGRKRYAIGVSKKGIVIDGSIFSFDRMSRLAIHPPTGAQSAGTIVMGFGIETMSIDIAPTVTVDEVQKCLPPFPHTDG